MNAPAELDNLNFSYNWNNKLQCKAYTTLRLFGNKYHVGKRFNVTLNNQPMHVAEVIEIKKIRLQDINEYIAHIDTGYSTIECRDIITRMYRSVDFRTAFLAFVLLKVVTEKN
jgi:hypothetical protein